jgi:TPR repeat protein
VIRRYHLAISAVGLSLIQFGFCHAEEPKFSDLLARANAQISAGHQWAPPGDNVTETLEVLLQKLPEATPQQLTEFDTLLRHTQESLNGKADLAPVKATQDTKNTNSNSADTVGSDTTSSSSAAGALTLSDPVTLSHQDQPSQTFATAVPPGAQNADERGIVPSTQKSTTAPETQTRSIVAPAQVAPLRSTESATKSAPLPHAANDPLVADALARGQAAQLRGDISAARRYFTVAAEGGDATAARTLGQLYDPAFLRRNTIGGVDSDIATSRRWYERAIALGDSQATPLLETLSAR